METNDTETEPKQMIYTQKEIKKMLMPLVGTVIDDWTVTYINLGKLRFTATYINEPPIINADIPIEDKVYTIGYIDTTTKRFTATLSNIIQDVPEVSDADLSANTVEKLI